MVDQELVDQVVVDQVVVDQVVVDQELVDQVVVVDATEAWIHNSLNSPTLDRPKLHPKE